MTITWSKKWGHVVKNDHDADEGWSEMVTNGQESKMWFGQKFKFYPHLL